MTSRKLFTWAVAAALLLGGVSLTACDPVKDNQATATATASADLGPEIGPGAVGVFVKRVAVLRANPANQLPLMPEVPFRALTNSTTDALTHEGCSAKRADVTKPWQANPTYKWCGRALTKEYGAMAFAVFPRTNDSDAATAVDKSSVQLFDHSRPAGWFINDVYITQGNTVTVLYDTERGEAFQIQLPIKAADLKIEDAKPINGNGPSTMKFREIKEVYTLFAMFFYGGA